MSLARWSAAIPRRAGGRSKPVRVTFSWLTLDHLRLVWLSDSSELYGTNSLVLLSMAVPFLYNLRRGGFDCCGGEGEAALWTDTTFATRSDLWSWISLSIYVCLQSAFKLVCLYGVKQLRVETATSGGRVRKLIHEQSEYEKAVKKVSRWLDLFTTVSANSEGHMSAKHLLGQ